MEIVNFIDKYWIEALNAEKRLKVPASYLLAHAAIETQLAETKALNYLHGFEVIIPTKVSAFKQFWINLWKKVKAWFVQEEVAVETKVVSLEDNVKDFFINVSYHAKFDDLQSADRFAAYIYAGKTDIKTLSDNFKDMVSKIQTLINKN
jgi:hypothetical protein